MSNFIYPCLSIKGKIEEAADFYIQTFGEGKIDIQMDFVGRLELSGQKFLMLNYGPESTPNPSISFIVLSDKAEETETYYNKLAEEGKILMPLDAYDWSERYGWLEDKFGVSWQLYTGKGDSTQKFVPTLMFTGPVAGKAEEALRFYTQLFPQSEMQKILRYSEADGENTEYVKHTQFKIKDYLLMAMDSSFEHGFQFNDAISLVVECEDQQEIDKYWEALSSNGGQEVACGWLTDKYGISWQIVPKRLAQLINGTEKGQRAMHAMLGMKKLIIADLENA